MATTSNVPAAKSGSALFSSLIGVTAVLIILQGVWAGVFIREGKDNDDTWVSVHDWGARAAILVALVSVVVALVQLRGRRDLVFGSIALFVLLLLEAYLGGLIGDHAAVEEIHFPLALVLVGLSVWLPMRARRRT